MLKFETSDYDYLDDDCFVPDVVFVTKAGSRIGCLWDRLEHVRLKVGAGNIAKPGKLVSQPLEQV